MPLTVTDRALDQFGNALARRYVRCYYSISDPFILGTDAVFRPGQGVPAAGAPVTTAIDASFSLTLFSQLEMDTGGAPVEAHIILPDGADYHGTVPAGISGPLTIWQLWSQFAWTGPQGPGRWAYPASAQMMGLLILSGPGAVAAAAIPVGSTNQMAGLLLL